MERHIVKILRSLEVFFASDEAFLSVMTLSMRLRSFLVVSGDRVLASILAELAGQCFERSWMQGS